MLFIIFGSDMEVNIKLFLINFLGDTKIDEVRMRTQWLIVPTETKFQNSLNLIK